MSTTDETKNIAKSAKEVESAKDARSTWVSIMRILIGDLRSSFIYTDRITSSHKLFDFLASDLSWKIKDSRFVVIVIDKLAEFKKDSSIGPDEREYFRKIEEKLGILKYCRATTTIGHQCSNTLAIDGKRNYCNTHVRRNNKVSKELNKRLPIGLDVSRLISEYM
jgi:hypothetical protein